MSTFVLVVEDYADLRSAIMETLARHEVVCESATTASDAIRKLSVQHYDTILLSPRLPIKDDPVMRYLHESQPGELPKVVLMTSGDPEEEADPNDCRVLLKPFNNKQLFARIDE
jgi:DNA-binding response OmpR family regulator